MNRDDLELFVRMTGEDNLKAIIECHSNSTVNAFKEAFKESFGDELHNAVKHIFR